MIATAELRKRSQDHSREFKVTARRLADFVASVEAEESLLLQRLQDAAARRIRPVDGDPSEAGCTSQSELDAAATPSSVIEPVSVPQPELYEEY
jgi:putative transposase